MSNQEPLFSFILPAYKAQFFREAIESILNQTYQNFELVIVNDASPEDLESIVNIFSDNRIRYYRNEQNIGGADLVKQWNHCLTFATGDFIILAADDDVYDKEFLSESVRLFKKYPEVPLLRAWTQSIDEHGNISDIDIKCAEYMNVWDFILVSTHISAGIGNYVFKKSELLKDSFINFPAAWWSDWATAINCAENGILFTDKILYSFRKSAIRVSSCNSKESICDKVCATKLFANWLENRMLIFDDTNEKKSYINICRDLYFKSNHFFFHCIQKLIFTVRFFDLLSVLTSVYKNNSISRREYYKLLIFYLKNKAHNIVKKTF